MAVEIRIPIPEAGATAGDAAGDLVSWFQARVEALSEALDQVVSEFDKKAQIDSIRIEAVEVTADAVSVTYRLSFSASDTCRGIDYAGTHQRTVQGRRDGESWIFQRPIPLPTRSTADEL